MGNPAGIEIVHIAVNLQKGQDFQTENFIRRAGYKWVLEDTNRTLARMFGGSGQPIFAIINGVADSPSHSQWELLLQRNGYGSRNHPIQSFQNVIDQVQAPIQNVDQKFEDWVSEHLLPTDQNGLGHDPDQDGSSNFLEFAMGTDPTNATSFSKLEVRRSVSTESSLGIELIYREAKNRTGFNFKLFKSESLNSWEPYQAKESSILKVDKNSYFDIQIQIGSGSSATFYRIDLIKESTTDI
ncbi:MAG TPA: hypothetical protein EYQ50_08855 [Verrucomicrobiales bacterium]|nr:hypothetical protein [Verrucomicrobiales bacterium]HIL69864.1 hypothetical protein [Verrucomicrobiota bacterium]